MCWKTGKSTWAEFLDTYFGDPLNLTMADVCTQDSCSPRALLLNLNITEVTSPCNHFGVADTPGGLGMVMSQSTSVTLMQNYLGNNFVSEDTITNFIENSGYQSQLSFGPENYGIGHWRITVADDLKSVPHCVTYIGSTPGEMNADLMWIRRDTSGECANKHDVFIVVNQFTNNYWFHDLIDKVENIQAILAYADANTGYTLAVNDDASQPDTFSQQTEVSSRVRYSVQESWVQDGIWRGPVVEGTDYLLAIFGAQTFFKKFFVKLKSPEMQFILKE